MHHPQKAIDAFSYLAQRPDKVVTPKQLARAIRCAESSVSKIISIVKANGHDIMTIQREGYQIAPVAFTDNPYVSKAENRNRFMMRTEGLG
jgi:biotin operon repressor